MTEAAHGPPAKFQVVGATGRMFVFDSPDERSASRETRDAGIHVGGGNHHALLEQLSGLLDEQTVCFVGKGRLALAALEAADKSSAASIRIILEALNGVTSAHLRWAGQSGTLQ